MKSKIVYEDDQVLVVHKPAGLATQTSKISEPDVVSELKNYLTQNSDKKAQGNKDIYIGVVHRLDQPVEGLLVFAKNKQSAASLSKQLQGGTLNKNYYAYVCGKTDKNQGELVDYLYKDSFGRAVIADEKDAKKIDAKKAVLRYRIVKEVGLAVYEKIENLLDGDRVYLTDIQIETGRFHQIRSQMSHANLPLLGDRKYGTKESMKIAEKLGIRTVALFAYSLEFVHPKTGNRMCHEIQWDSMNF